LIPPAYVKPFVQRQNNDAADAEAIAEAASRPTMRFVAVKTAEQQARACCSEHGISWFVNARS
jgi:transposase